jgi:tripartite-type tricarboxylate transporter receptor subunit TctC
MPIAIRRRTAIGAGLAAAVVAAPSFAGVGRSQSFTPTDGVARIVAPFAAGGTTDAVARVVAHILSQATGSPFMVDNRTGASGDVSAEIVAKASPDGRTLLLGHVGTAVTNQYLRKYVPYDSVESFAPISLVGEVPNVLVVHPRFPASSLKEFVDYCATQGPSRVSYASPSSGETGHLAMEYLQGVAGVRLNHVAFASRSRMLAALLAGNVLVAMDNLPTCLPYIRSGALRALAVSSSRRWFAAPEIPTVAEQGYADFDATLWWYLAAPAGTRLDLVNKLSLAVANGIRSEAMIAKIRNVGVHELSSCPEDLVIHIAAEKVKWKKVIDQAGLMPQ